MGSNGKVDKAFQIGLNLAEMVVAKVKSLTALDEEELVYKATMFFFFCKAYKSFQACRVLWKQGFGEDAFILARTIFEMALQARYMKQAPKPRARLFTEYDPVMRYRYYRNLKRLGDAELVRSIESRTQELSELRQSYDRLKAKYPEGKGWWGRSVGWLARHLGKGTEKHYAIVYWMQSNLVHSAVTALRQYLREEESGLKVNCYPSPSSEVRIPMVATQHFLDIIWHTTEALGLDLATDFESALDSFQAIVRNTS